MSKLREICFDVPYVPSSYIESKLVGKQEEERNKITVEDYNKNYKKRNFEFRLQTRCIASFFERLIGEFENDNCRKIIIECVSQINRKISHCDGFYLVQIVYDVNSFFNLNDLEKKQKTLELIKNGLDKIIEKEDWDKTIFDNVYSQIVDSNYINQWIWRKKKNNSTRKYIAEVLCEHDIYSCDISVIITDKKGFSYKKTKSCYRKTR